MREYKILSFEDTVDHFGVSREVWLKIRNLPREEYIQAVRETLTWPEGFLEQLKGMPLEEQMSHYRIVETVCRSRTAYGEITKENAHRFGYALDGYRGLTGLIVEDGVLIGVRLKNYTRPYGWGLAAFPYQDVCTYYACDDNGSGRNDREDYAHLCCVMPDAE